MKKSLILVLLLAGCAAPAQKTASPDAKQLDEVRATAQSLATRLGGKLKQEIGAHGPAAAVGVCKTSAPQIAAELSQQTGWTVGRVGTRARNAETGTPDAWNAKALAVFAERLKQGEKPDTMELSEVVSSSTGQTYLRYAKAMVVQPVCLTCHGSPKDIPEDVSVKLRAEYPTDKATGYHIGELRGAIVVKRPL